MTATVSIPEAHVRSSFSLVLLRRVHFGRRIIVDETCAAFHALRRSAGGMVHYLPGNKRRLPVASDAFVADGLHEWTALLDFQGSFFPRLFRKGCYPSPAASNTAGEASRGSRHTASGIERSLCHATMMFEQLVNELHTYSLRHSQISISLTTEGA